jgi:hypothetical protein
MPGLLEHGSHVRQPQREAGPQGRHGVHIEIDRRMQELNTHGTT